MSRRHRFKRLFSDPQFRYGGFSQRTVSTGFASLDQALAGGWPAAALTELLLDDFGIGEFSLLLPALNTLTGDAEGEDRWIMLVNPPHVPYAPALSHRGLDISCWLMTHPKSPADVLWTAEQALRSGSCAAVLLWSEVSDMQLLRRLQLAAETGDTWAVLFRPLRFRLQRSPAAVRIRLQPLPGQGLELDIFKHRAGQPCTVIIRTEQ